MKGLLVSVGIGAALLAFQALAQQTSAAQTPQAQAQQEGRSGWMNGPLTRDQAKQRADMMFQRLDLNHDGTLTREEADQVLDQMSSGDNSARADRMERMFDRLFGGAKSVTHAQFQAQALARFDAMDLNHDGTITPDERQQAMAAMHPKQPAK